jgi:hypothetical protein
LHRLVQTVDDANLDVSFFQGYATLNFLWQIQPEQKWRNKSALPLPWKYNITYFSGFSQIVEIVLLSQDAYTSSMFDLA